tara:strand:+ start:3637 stop:4839 length:1203 start_codon:yes stop_codon:yes gene_type:complete
MSIRKPPEKKLLIKKFDGDNVPDNFDFPSIGIENIDRALFNLFDKQLSFETSAKGVTKKVPVIFSTGERFVLTRRKKPIRDRNNTNILPLISIQRQNFDLGPNQGGKSTAISFRAQPNYKIKYRLSEKDRTFQNLINKQNIKNQDNVASTSNFQNASTSLNSIEGTIATRRDTNNLKFSKNAQISLKPDIETNIFEIINIPYPYFFTVTYNITFWAQYMQQGNQMVEYLLNNLDVPGGEFAIKTEEGYELVAFISENVNFENNFDSMTDDERIIKYSFDMTIPGYILNPRLEGQPNQLRSFYSAPIIDFSYIGSSAPKTTDYQPETNKEKVQRHVLTDVTNVDNLKIQRGETSESTEVFVKNPFSSEGETEFLKIKNSNSRTGESIVSSKIVKEIDRQYE